MMSSFLQRIVINKEIKFKDGGLFLMNSPAYMFSLNALVIAQDMLSKELGEKGRFVLFKMMEAQTTMAGKMMLNRFGFPKEKALKLQLGHGEMIGGGRTQLVKADFKNNHFIVKVDSTFAKEYLNTFGQQKTAIDTMTCGAFTGLFRTLTGNKNLICIETNCIASGKPHCEFVIKDKKLFNLKDKKISSQIPPKINYNFDKVMKDKMGVPIRKR